MDFSNIPIELKSLKQWVAWSLVKRDGKFTKLPINPLTGDLAKTNDPSTWGTFKQAESAGSRLSGIGFVFTKNDPYVGIDLDGHIDSDVIKWFDSYTEYSQSGKGVHIIVKGLVGRGRKNSRYEIYDRGRFFIFTGNLLNNKSICECQDKIDSFIAEIFPEAKKNNDSSVIDLSSWLKPVSQDSIIDLIRNSHQAGKFEPLWSGSIEGYPSQSEADMALLSILRFWTGGSKDQSIQLFSQSGLGRRKKWKRLDYQDSTWKKIDFGEVYQKHIEVIQPIIEKKLSPWRKVKDRHIREIITGTALEPLVRLFESPMNPSLPLPAALLKSVALAGCALCDKKEPDSHFEKAIHRGIDLAKLKIMSARGQACNIYGLLVALSGSGKDIGGLIDYLAVQNGWLIGTSGSAEGLADTLANEQLKKHNGYLAISEFTAFLDKRNWQHKAASFLTESFNKGWFSVKLSTKNSDMPRESNFCYPSILANIQPEAMQTYANTIDLSTGFLSRFLVARIPDDYYGRPACCDFDPLIEEANRAIACYKSKKGKVEVGDNYLADVYQMFREHKAGIRSHWSRLVNEYGPRFRVMLSVPMGDTGKKITFANDSWEKAGLMVQWFYSMAEDVLTKIQDDEYIAKREKLLSRIVDFVRTQNGATAREITRAMFRGTTKKERQDAIDELLDRNVIIAETRGKAIFYRITT